MARIIRRSRWLCVRWVIFLLIVSGVLALCFVTYELDAVIHQRVLKSFQERFTSANVYLSTAHLVRGEGIELSQFVLMADYQPEKDSSHTSFPPVLEAEHVMLDCPSRLEELAVMKEIPVTSITFDTATIHAYRRPDGSWSLSALKTNSDAASAFPAPVICFRNTSIVLHDMTDSRIERKLILRNVEMTINTAQKTNRNALGHSVPDETSREKTFMVFPFQGTAESEFCRNVSFYGNFYAEEGEILVEVDVRGLQYSNDFLNAIPCEIADRFSELREIRGQIDTHAKVAADLNDFSSAHFRLDGKMTDGRSTDPRFPKLVSNISADFQITNEGFLFPNLTVRYGDGSLNLNVSQRGYGPGATKKISSKFRRIELSEAFFASLPEGMKKLMQDLSPTGQFDLDADFLFDGQYWSTTGRVLCSNISMNYVQFPYRLDHLNGEILLKGSQISCQFLSADKRIRINGNFTAPSKQHPVPPAGFIQVQASRIPVDERLLAACPRKATDFIRTLEVGGSINVTANYQFSLAPENPQNHVQITINLLKNSCRYRDFPYPLRDLEGTILIDDDSLSTQNLRGSNGNAEVQLSLQVRLPSAFNSGFLRNPGLASSQTSAQVSNLPQTLLQPKKLLVEQTESASDQSSTEWKIQILGTNVTLDEELYSNLPAQAAEIFRYIQPYGTVNVRFEYHSPAQAIIPGISSSLSGIMDPLSPAKPNANKHLALWVETVGKGIRISLPAMRYWLNDFKGSFQFQNGQFAITDFDAVHDSTRFSGKASGNVTSINQWDFHFEQLTVDGLRFDQDLMAAIPESVRVPIAARRPEGALYYRGGMDVHYDNRTEKKPFSVDWKGEIGLTEGALDLNFPITAINGGIQICGHWDQNAFYCGGEVEIDSLFQQNVQLTKIQGPLWIDSHQILLGGDADRLLLERLHFRVPTKNSAASRSLSAHFVGGDLYGTFALQFGYPSTFQSHIVLTNGQLENCSYLTGNDQLKAKMFGSLTLTGTDSSLHSLRGKGEFHLTDANLYKLSAMMSLLKILSLKEVNDTGFSSSDMKFHVEGNHIYFDQIDFYGDAFSLIGKGEMDFKSQIKLVFYSVMGRNDKKIPILSPLLHATGRQMMLITMKGPVQNPEISQQPLPGLNMAIQQMESDLPHPPSTPGSSRPGLFPRESGR